MEPGTEGAAARLEEEGVVLRAARLEPQGLRALRRGTRA